jgi:hypothetical protein
VYRCFLSPLSPILLQSVVACLPGTELFTRAIFAFLIPFFISITI